MSALLPVIVSAEVLYGVACGLLGARPGAPLWLRWPIPVWEFLRHGPKPAPRPDYAKIARLERELGLGWACGGVVAPRAPEDGELVVLSPGRRITDPHEAEALGLTADARRMRGETP